MPSVGEIFQRSYESIADVLGMIDTVHVKIHRGKFFAATHNFGIVASAGGTADILLQNPADNYAHLSTYNFNPDTAPADVKIYEGVTFSAEGSAPDTGLQNLSTAHGSPNLNVTVNPTIDTTGTLIDITGLTAGKRASNVGVNYREWVLEPSQDYLVRFTNDSNADSTICIAKIGWYEN